MKNVFFLVSLILSAAACAEPALPGKQEVESALMRNFGWLPDTVAKVRAIRESVIPGMAEVRVELKKGELTNVYITADGKAAFIGEMIPFGPDPFASARKRLENVEGPSRGNTAGAVTLVVFSDLECPYCRNFDDNLRQLAADIPQVRQVFQAFPLPTIHPWALLAAGYADCAARENAKSFWPFSEKIFAVQKEISLENAPGKFAEIAKSLGLDAPRLAACATAPETLARIESSRALGRSLFIRGTPTAFVNGRQIPAGLPYEQLESLVRFEMEHAGR